MKVRYLCVLAAVCGVLAIIGLRYNHTKSHDLSQQIINKDRQAQPVTEELAQLRRFVFAHMNASTKVELNASYERALGSSGGATGDLYAQAQAECDRRGVSSVAQAQCVQDFLNARLQPSQNTTGVNKADYIHSFASPGWSPDLAGFGLLGAIVFGLAALVLYIIRLFKSRPEPTL